MEIISPRSSEQRKMNPSRSRNVGKCTLESVETEIAQTELPVSDANWQNSAACKSEDPNIFFPRTGSRTASEDAKKICNTCNVREVCLAEALERNEYGVWGGLSKDERRALKRSAKRKNRAI